MGSSELSTAPICNGCNTKMPTPRDDHEIAAGWTVVRIEAHGNATLSIGYMYVCPSCTITITPAQTSLLEG
jgi:hypothetical protein